MGAEVAIAGLVIGAGLLVFARLRSVRLSGNASQIPPFALGFYRGCAFVIIIVALFAIGSVAWRLATNHP